MNPLRRRALLLPCAAWLLQGAGAQAADDGVRRGRVLVFPRDHGAHLGARTEWWYVTGWLGSESEPTHGVQVTFFRSRTGLAEHSTSRFAARQLLFAHAAVTALDTRAHLHDQRIERWSGEPGVAVARAAADQGDVQIGRWRLKDDGRGWRAQVDARDFGLDLAFARTQPLLLQGEAGWSRKGPQERQASHYYSEPQLAASGRVAVQGRAVTRSGRAWLDHEWSDELLHPEAVGWDWVGFNLFDGSALTAFVLRRRDGSAVWAGGSWRAAGKPARAFGPGEVTMTPLRIWRSPASGAGYPVRWRLQTPAGRHEVRALADEQELDSRGSTGSIYWEGLSELVDAGGRRVGLGYLELTGYAQPLKL